MCEPARTGIENMDLVKLCLVVMTASSCHSRSVSPDDDRAGRSTDARGVAGSSTANDKTRELTGDAGVVRAGKAGTGAAGNSPAQGGAAKGVCTLPQQRRGWQLVSCCAGVLCNGQCIDGQCACYPSSSHHGCEDGAVCCATGGCRVLAADEECRGGPP